MPAVPLAGPPAWRRLLPLRLAQPVTSPAAASAAFPPFPAGPLGAKVELLLGTAWTDVTPYVAYKRQPVAITRGHPDESTATNPSTLAAAFDNTGGRFSSKNPLGPWYGLIGRNTPVRVSIPEAAPYLRIEGDNASYAQAADTPGLSIAGDTDIQLEVTLDNWRDDQMLAAKWAETGSQRSWVFYLQNGTLHFGFSANGSSSSNTNSSVFGGAGSVPVPALHRQCLRVTFQASSGTVRFYTSPAPLSSAVWTPLGDVSGFGAASIFDSSAPVQLGYAADAASVGLAGIYGKVHAFSLLSGIGGTPAASPNFGVQVPGAASFTDAQANTWVVAGTAEISARKYRGHFEASAWTPSSDGTPGKSLWMDLSAGGLLRRIQQDTQTLSSAFRRALPSALALVGYWPAEDGNTSSSGTTPATPAQFASAVQGVPAGTFTGALPQFASDSSFLCSQSLPGLNKSRWHFRLPSRGPDTANVFRFLLHMPSSSDTNNGVVARMYTAGTVGTLDLVYTTGGALTLNGYDQSGNLLFSNGPAAFATDGALLWCSLELQKSGSNVQYSVVTLAPGASTGSATTGTVAGRVGNASLLVMNGNIGTAALSGTAAGHFTYQSQWQSLFTFGTQLNAWQGEAAGTRFARLCAEQGIAFRAIGSLADTVAMGAQTPLAFGALLQECADADLGMMFEPRQALALGYRTRASLQSQAPAAALDYSLDGFTGMMAPPSDDQITKNDVTVTRAYTSGGGTGSSAEAVVTSGPLSVQAPPNGVGPYLDAQTVNLFLDSQLADAAGWRAWLGTVDQPRYPAIPFDLARQDIGARLYTIPDVDVGDRITIGSPPVWEPPDGISQLAAQCAETIAEKAYSIVWTGIPETPYQTGVIGDPVYARVDTDGSALDIGASAVATSLQVATAPGAPTVLWTTAAADFPFDISVGGERITVTNITGSSSPQTFIVVRSVNGVVKAQPTGQDVRLFFPTIVSL